jgi:hypothetical protein
LLFVVVLMVGVVVLLLLLLRSSATAVGWWWGAIVRGMVASVDVVCCFVVGGVCIVECSVVVLHVGWSGDANTGGGVLDVDIWVCVGFGGGGVGFGGCIVSMVLGGVVGGFGGVVVVFCHRSLLPSKFPVLLGLRNFPALSCFPSSTPSLWGW